jgi:hypothetical protein
MLSPVAVNRQFTKFSKDVTPNDHFTTLVVSFDQDGGEDYDTMKHTLRDVLLDIDKLQVPPPPNTHTHTPSCDMLVYRSSSQ